MKDFRLLETGIAASLWLNHDYAPISSTKAYPHRQLGELESKNSDLADQFLTRPELKVRRHKL